MTTSSGPRLTVDPLVRILLVAVPDRVGHGLANGQIDPMTIVVGETRSLQGVPQDHLHQLDVLKPASDGEMESGICLGHRSSLKGEV